MQERWMNLKNKKTLYITITMLLVGAIGIITLLPIYAATQTVSIEIEKGAVSGSVSMTDDASASGGKAVAFASPDIADHAKKCSQLSGLKFCDDFDGAQGSAPDSTKWNVFGSGSSWGSQCWKSGSDNISMDGQGKLKLTLINTNSQQCTNSYGDPSTVTSGGMDTKGRFTTKYGKFEIRSKLSCADSTWGSIWLSTGTGPGWPASGEIDIWETGYLRKHQLQSTIHAGTSSSNHYHLPTFYNLPTDEHLCDDYHVYGVEWRRGYIQFMFDGKPTNRIAEADAAAAAQKAGKPAHWPFDTHDLRLLIDLQYGKSGIWTGAPNLNQLPSSMFVDYVRIYE